MGVVFCFPALLVSLIGAYIYPLLAQFDNTIKNTLKNAIACLPIGNLPYSLVMAALNLAVPAPAPVCDKLFPADVHLLAPDRRFARRDAQFISAAENLQKVF